MIQGAAKVICGNKSIQNKNPSSLLKSADDIGILQLAALVSPPKIFTLYVHCHQCCRFSWSRQMFSA